MTDFVITTAFNEIYRTTYKIALAYVMKKCGNAEDIADILQETYAEIYIVLVRKGPDYLQNTAAFVLQVAKTKIHRHYSLTEKLKSIVPISFRNDDGEEIDISDLEQTDLSVEDRWIDHLLVEDIARCVASKPGEVQKVFYSYFFLDMSIRQIASALAIKESTVKNRIYRTVKEIRKLYGKDGDYR